MNTIFVKAKKGSLLYGERICIDCILITSIITLIIAIFLKIFNSNCIFNFNSSDFVENIFLGLSASAFISFLTLYVPFIFRVKKELTEFKEYTYKIMSSYKYIIGMLKFSDIPVFKVEDENYESFNKYSIPYIENLIKSNCKRILLEIHDFNQYKKSMNITSTKIEQIFDIINNEPYKSILSINKFYEQIEKTDLDLIKENDKEYYNFYVEFTKNIYDFINNGNVFENICSKINKLRGKNKYFEMKYDIDIVNDQLIKALEDVEDSITENKIVTITTMLVFKKNQEIIKSKSKGL